MHVCSKERFLEDVSSHKLTVLKEDGVYRHLKFSDGSFNMQFDIITWPGNLCYTGDMGSYLFTRVEDMFTFFRGDDLKINTGYWAEKCQASGTNDGLSVYDQEEAVETIRDILKQESAHGEIVDEIEENVIPCSEDEFSLRQAMSELEHDYEDIFCDFWEVDLHVRPYRYIWCCYALVWAIALYDSETTK